MFCFSFHRLPLIVQSNEAKQLNIKIKLILFHPMKSHQLLKKKKKKEQEKRRFYGPSLSRPPGFPLVLPPGHCWVKQEELGSRDLDLGLGVGAEGMMSLWF